MVFTFNDYGFPFLWGLIMLASWIGWGDLLGLVLGLRGARMDWALRAGWGMSVTLGIAGFLQLAHLADQTFLVALVLLGTAVWGGGFYIRMRKDASRRRVLALLLPRRLFPLLPVILLLVFFYATSIQTYDVDWWDDLPSYFVMIKRLLQTGIILDPYSVRRLLTFGGQQVLDVQLLGAVSIFHVDILEQGLARILFAGLLWGGMPRVGVRNRWVKGILLVLLLLIPIPHVNTNSQLTGSVLFLTLLRTFELQLRDMPPLLRAVPIGLVAAAFATLRMNFVPTAGLAMGLVYGARLLWPQTSRRNIITEAAMALLIFALLLMPWSIVLHESSGSYLYPLFRGTQRPDYDYLNANFTPAQTAAWILRFVGVPGIPPVASAPGYVQEPFFAITALLLPMVLVFNRRSRGNELPFYLAAIAAMFLTLFTYTLTEYPNLYRFVFPALFAIAALVLTRAVLSAKNWPVRILPTALFCFLVAANLLRPVRGPSGRYNHDSFPAMYDDMWNVWHKARTSTLFALDAQADAYEAAQHTIPPGKAIFVAVSFPSLLDFSRNTIFPIDMVGGASPDPGMPLLAGPEAVRTYLKDQGIDYLVFSSPDKDLAHLSRSIWSIASQSSAESPAFRRVAKFNVAAINDFEALARTQDVLYLDDTLRVVHLR